MAGDAQGPLRYVSFTIFRPLRVSMMADSLMKRNGSNDERVGRHPAYRLALLLEKIIDGHAPSGHGWLGIGDLPSAENDRMVGVAGLVGLDHILTQ